MNKIKRNSFLTGEIRITSPLDREDKSSYNLLVQAYDNYRYGFTTGDSRNTFIQLEVKVGDVNDETPKFVEVNSECTTISEFHKKHEPVVNVRATDNDDPTQPNSDIAFTIKEGNEKGVFRIKSIGRGIARIYPSDTLKGQYGNYSLTVEATDKGYPPNTEAAVFSICVQVNCSKIGKTTATVKSIFFRILMIMPQSLCSLRRTLRSEY